MIVAQAHPLFITCVPYYDFQDFQDFPLSMFYHFAASAHMQIWDARGKPSSNIAQEKAKR